MSLIRFLHILLATSTIAGLTACNNSTQIDSPPSVESSLKQEQPQPVYKDVLVSTVAELREAVQNLEAGTRLLLEDGEYRNVGHLSFSAQGTRESPILISPRNPHQVVITGEMSWTVTGQHITFCGLDFIDCINVPTDLPYASLIYGRDSSDSIRFSACRFISCELELKENGKSKGRLITFHGDNHRFDHCFFYDVIGGVLAIKGPDRIDDRAEKGFALIDHNIFREMGRQRALKDQGEALFLGTGFEHRGHRRVGAIVEFNIFDRAIGDTHGEIITVKSSENIFRNNLFINSPGTWWEGGAHLSLRSTDDCLIYDNLFQDLGCGIWVTGHRHQIYNNYFVDIDHAGLLFPAGNIASIVHNESVTMLDGTLFDMNNTEGVYGKISAGFGAAFRAAQDCTITNNYFGELHRYAVIATDKRNSEVGSLPIQNNRIANNIFEAAMERRNDPFMNIDHPDKNTITDNTYLVEAEAVLGELGENAVVESMENHAFPIQDMATLQLPPVPPMPGSLTSAPLLAEYKTFPDEITSNNYLVLDAAYSAGDIVEYHWDFGDGSESISRGNAIAHRWINAGTYKVSLTVTDAEGAVSVYEQALRVESH